MKEIIVYNKLLNPEISTKWRKLNPETSIKWRKQKFTPVGKKQATLDIEWCFLQLECGYYVVLVKWGGLVGASYCAPDDALPHWNPQKSIELAFARRRILETAANTIEDFVLVEYLVLGGFAPHKVIGDIRKNYARGVFVGKSF